MRLNYSFKIRQIRLECEEGKNGGLTQKQLAEILNCTESTIKNIESDSKSIAPSLELIYQICKHFKLSLHFFINQRMSFKEGQQMGLSERLVYVISKMPIADQQFLIRFCLNHLRETKKDEVDKEMLEIIE